MCARVVVLFLSRANCSIGKQVCAMRAHVYVRYKKYKKVTSIFMDYFIIYFNI